MTHVFLFVSSIWSENFFLVHWNEMKKRVKLALKAATG